MSDPFWLLTWISSEVFAFLAIALAVQGVFLLFRVKNPRIRACFRSLPLIGLLVDPFFNSWSVGRFLNPLSCDSCLQKFSLYFFPELKTYLATHQISLTKYLVTQFSFISIVPILIAFSAVTAVVFVGQMIRLGLDWSRFKQILQDAEIFDQTVGNIKLSEKLKKNDVELRISDRIEVPMAVGRRTILIPRKVSEQLSGEELDAVIAHELAHLQYKDPMIRLFYQIVSGFFWWIPMRWWLKRIEDDQEMGADESVAQYNIPRDVLASALVKVVYISRNKSTEASPVFCQLTDRASSLLTRLTRLLHTTKPFKEKLLWQGGIAIAAGLLVLVGCMMF